MRFLFLLAAVFAWTGVAFAQKASSADGRLITVTEYKRVATKPTAPPILEISYSITIKNNSNVDLRELVVEFSDIIGKAEFADQVVLIPFIRAGGTVVSNDLITVRVNQRGGFQVQDLSYISYSNVPEGLDLDRNGIRDDVDLALTEVSSGNRVYDDAVRQYAQNLQSVTTRSYASPPPSRDEALEAAFILSCMIKIRPEARVLADALHILTFNTEERWRLYEAYEASVPMSALRLPETSEFETFCLVRYNMR